MPQSAVAMTAVKPGVSMAGTRWNEVSLSRLGFAKGEWPRGGRGFTLVELMITLVILAILIGIAVPSYRSTIADQRVRAAMSDLHTALVLARSEAVKRNRQVTLSPAGGGWNAGWSIANPGGGDPILSHGLVSGVDIDGTEASIVFSASGRLVGAALEFEVSSTDDAEALGCLTLGIDGRASSEKGGC